MHRNCPLSAFSCCFFSGQATGAAAAELAVHSIGTGWLLVIGAVGVASVGGYFNRRRMALPESAGIAVRSMAP